MKSLIKSATARPVGKKWEITAHFEDGTSEIILKRGANRGFVQQYENAPDSYHVTFGKTIQDVDGIYVYKHVRTIPLTEAA